MSEHKYDPERLKSAADMFEACLHRCGGDFEEDVAYVLTAYGVPEMEKLFECGKAARIAINPTDGGTCQFADPGAQETYDAIWSMRRTIANLRTELARVDEQLKIGDGP
jgi:hypothetical protein